MKTFLVIVSCFIALHSVAAQAKGPNITVAFSSQTMSFHPMPSAADAKELPLLVSKTAGGELFGFSFKGTAPTSPFLELLDNTGKVIRTLTVNDLFGGKATNAVTLISSKVTGSQNRSENMYEISTPQGKAGLTISAIATSINAAVPGKLMVKILLTKYSGAVASARITIPFVGTAETKEKGFVLTGTKSPNALAGTLFSTVEKIAAANKKLVVTTIPEDIGEGKVLLSMAVEGVNTKQEAETMVKDFAASTGNDIVIINTSDKASAQPSDTITYRVHCINIGKGPVSNVVVTNPISNGTKYMEGSASGEDTEISFERMKVTPPQVGEVRSVTWKFTKNVPVGAEKVVQFKVIVQ